MDSRQKALYDRQLYVLGEAAMGKIKGTNVLIAGLSGLGAEIAKNVILTGVGSVTLYDPKPVAWSDLASQFCFDENSIGKNRVSECVKKLAELNQYVTVQEFHGELTESELKKYQVVVFTDDCICNLTKYNEICRANGTKFIACESRGLFGAIFTDYGNEFEVIDVDGEEPITRIVVGVQVNENTGDASISVDDEVRHGYSDGDLVKFSDLQGEGMDVINQSKDPYTVQSTGPYNFIIKGANIPKNAKYARGGYVTQVKKHVKLQFKSLQESIEDPLFLEYDFAKLDFPPLIHLCFRSLALFASHHKRLPKSYNQSDAETLLKLAQEINEKSKNKIEINAEFVKKFSFVAAGNLNPIAASIGGFAAQEVQKACTGKFTPIKQFFYFDALEALPQTLPTEDDASSIGSRYDGQIAVFGKQFQDKILHTKAFVVGAGALGCEFLKNFAMVGVGCSPKGKVIVTDMDNIEISNLSRQFLFRNHHVGGPKSVTAAEAVKKMNSNLNITALQDKVAPDTEKIFDDDFWEGIDLVTNALDNVEARLYTDSRCVLYKKPLLESGTLGTKANVQVVVPNVTESYGSSRDPPEKEIKLCTLKQFPYMIEHTIAWAKDLFAGYFSQNMEDCNSYLSRGDEFINTLQSGKFETIQGIYENLVSARPHSFEDCVVWARLKFEELFSHQIRQLLYSFPLDAVTSTGTPFWFGQKRPPTPLTFDVNNHSHLEFVIHASCLRAFAYNIHVPVHQSEDAGSNLDPATLAKVKQVCANVVVPDFQPKQIKIATDDKELQEQKNANQNSLDLMGDDQKLNELLRELNKARTVNAGLKLTSSQFEKDDDSNHHIDFITATSNLRASNYQIPEADRHKTKGVAGKIIPAMVTTTALITGLVGLELYKVLLNKTNIDDYKNGFVNIAIPFITLSTPMPAPKNKYNDTEYTLWDHILLDYGTDVTLKELMDNFTKQYKLSISMISCGKAQIFSFFMNNEKKKERLATKVSQIYRTVTNQDFYPTQKYLSLEFLVENEEGEDVDIPGVRYKFKGFQQNHQ